MSYTFHEAEAMLWDGMRSIGMLRRARATLPDGQSFSFDVDLAQPDVPLLDDAGVSTQWQIEYRECEAPGLVRDVVVWIEEPGRTGMGRKFKVREQPTTEDGGTGYFRTATLTELECD